MVGVEAAPAGGGGAVEFARAIFEADQSNRGESERARLQRESGGRKASNANDTTAREMHGPYGPAESSIRRPSSHSIGL